MKTASSLAKACLARSTKLSSVKPLRFSGDRGSRFDYAEVSNLGMYLHIPACGSSGGFGNADRSAHPDEEERSAVLEALLSAIDFAGSAVWKSSHAVAPCSRKPITTLFIRGNTALLDARALESVVCAVRKRFAIACGIGFELASTEIDAERLHMLHRAGITHLAVTVASQPAGNNPSGAPDAVEHDMLNALKNVPFETVSLAFAFAQPGQTPHQLQQSIDTALASGANHIAIKPFNSREAKRFETDRPVQPTRLVEFGCATTTLASSTFKVNAYSITEYGRRLGAGRPPAAAALRIVERERMLRYVLWSARNEARLLLAQTALLCGIGCVAARKRPHGFR